MEDLSYLAQGSPNLLFAITLSLLGMLFYWGIIIQAAKAKMKDAFNIGLWWDLNWLNVAVGTTACLLVFIGSWSMNALTVERCIGIGMLGALLSDKFKRLL